MLKANKKYQFQTICECGAVRSNNEDAIKQGICSDGDLEGESIAWMVIADGMGGHQAGEVASNILVNEIEGAIEQLTAPTQVDWCCWLEVEINRANNKIFGQAKKNPAQSGMGTTAVVAIVQQSVCYIAWVGDSRAYIYHTSESGSLTQLTQDHTMIQALLDKGAITKKEALESTNKNMLSRAVGIKKGVDVDTINLPIADHDIILLSTDGLHDSLEHLKFEQILSQIQAGSDVTKQLVAQAIANGSRDNITFGSVLIIDNVISQCNH